MENVKIIYLLLLYYHLEGEHRLDNFKKVLGNNVYLWLWPFNRGESCYLENLYTMKELQMIKKRDFDYRENSKDFKILYRKYKVN